MVFRRNERSKEAYLTIKVIRMISDTVSKISLKYLGGGKNKKGRKEGIIVEWESSSDRFFYFTVSIVVLGRLLVASWKNQMLAVMLSAACS